MPLLTLLIGSALIALGLGGWIVSGREHMTALIPAFIGLPMAVCGLLGLRRPLMRRQAMHAALILSLLIFLGTVKAVPTAIGLLAGGSHERELAIWAQSLTALLALTHLVAGIRSFIAARRARALASPEPTV